MVSLQKRWDVRETDSCGEDFKEAIIDLTGIVELILLPVQSDELEPGINVAPGVFSNSVLQLTNAILREARL